MSENLNVYKSSILEIRRTNLTLERNEKPEFEV